MFNVMGVFLLFPNQAGCTTWHVYAAPLRVAGNSPVSIRKVSQINISNSFTQMLPEMELTEADFLEGSKNTETQ